MLPHQFRSSNFAVQLPRFAMQLLSFKSDFHSAIVKFFRTSVQFQHANATHAFACICIHLHPSTLICMNLQESASICIRAGMNAFIQTQRHTDVRTDIPYTYEPTDLCIFILRFPRMGILQTMGFSPLFGWFGGNPLFRKPPYPHTPTPAYMRTYTLIYLPAW